MTSRTRAPEPVFEAPWHAQLFALTVHLHDKGLFDWPYWTQRFADALKLHGLSKDLNGGDDYFMAWLTALEALLSDAEIAMPDQVQAIKTAWETAYLSTPHGQPVQLS